MSFTESLRQLLPEQRSHKSLAMDWLGRREQAGHAVRSASYVESRFSRCLSGDPAAVRFFFGARDSAATLMDVLDVPPAARDELLAAADRHLADGPQHPPARMVIDLSRWSKTTAAKALFESLRTQVIEPALVTPAVLIVSPHLHEDLPRSFDKIEWLRVVVTEPDQAEDPARDLLADGALLVSPTPAANPAHWLAIDFDQKVGRVILEPTDGLARFARDGQIPLPAVEHDLVDAVADLPPAPPPAMDAFGPIETRRLMTRLRQESDAGSVSKDPAVRIALARAIGVVATSTKRDRIEASLRVAIAGLGVPTPAVAKQADLDRVLARARRRPVGPTTMRVDDVIHYVNPPEASRGLEHACVRVHQVAAPEPEIARLRAAIANWTIGDFEADPFLVGVIDRLDPDRRDLLAFLHARAWLLALGIVKLAPGRPIDDWRAALRLLLDSDVPPAMLMLTSDHTEHAASYVAIAIPPWLAKPLDGVGDQTTLRLRHVPSALTAVPVARGDRPHRANVLEDRYSGQSARTQLALPASTEDGATEATFDDDWLDAFDAFVGNQPGQAPRVRPVSMTETKDLPWEAADRILPTAWLALRVAIDGNVAVRSQDGRVTLHLGGGLAAVITVTSTAEDRGALRVMMDCVSGRDGYGTAAKHSLESRISAGVDNVAFAVPTRVVVVAGYVRAEITFIASPLLLGGAGGDVAVQAARSAVQAAIEAAEARRRADDYDDDDD